MSASATASATGVLGTVASYLPAAVTQGVPAAISAASSLMGNRISSEPKDQIMVGYCPVSAIFALAIKGTTKEAGKLTKLEGRIYPSNMSWQERGENGDNRQDLTYFKRGIPFAQFLYPLNFLDGHIPKEFKLGDVLLNPIKILWEEANEGLEELKKEYSFKPGDPYFKRINRWKTLITKFLNTPTSAEGPQLSQLLAARTAKAKEQPTMDDLQFQAKVRKIWEEAHQALMALSIHEDSTSNGASALMPMNNGSSASTPASGSEASSASASGKKGKNKSKAGAESASVNEPVSPSASVSALSEEQKIFLKKNLELVAKGLNPTEEKLDGERLNEKVHELWDHDLAKAVQLLREIKSDDPKKAKTARDNLEHMLNYKSKEFFDFAKEMNLKNNFPFSGNDPEERYDD